MGAPADSEPSLEGPEPDVDIGVDIAADIAAPAPTAGLGPGQRRSVAGRYLLLEHIAEGGMGSVYVAEHALSKKKLALKLVHPYLCRGRQGVERFRREVSAAAEIDHPGIVQVYDAGTDDDGGFFMAMELLEGESLGDRLRRSWPGMKSAVALVDGMLEPLAKAHAKGFVHRDLKPDNIFLAVLDDGGERVKLLDFGLAREVDKSGATRTGITFGTPEYMSPEQAMSARKVRAPGDVWSVGVMLYELLSGDHPFTGETPNAIMANAIKEPLPSLRERAPHVPLPLARVIERALEKEPKARPQSAGELLEELRAAVAECGELDETVPVAPNPPGAWSSSEEGAVSSSYPVQRQPQAKLPTHVVADGDSQPETKRRRNPALFVIGGAVAMGLLLIVGSLAYRVFGAPDADAATAVSAEGARLEPPPAPPESPSESAAAERPAR
ncbi:MAG: serine/threonine-protein kinase, partial [Sandaracinaceae bacterium]